MGGCLSAASGKIEKKNNSQSIKLRVMFSRNYGFYVMCEFYEQKDIVKI